ncbi:ROK family protein [candidate division WOR-3 bacterium]|nr:ROK family protein [candidate division WOR-3 bacterium]
MDFSEVKDYQGDGRMILTLDAGGTNFAFQALKGEKSIIDPVFLPSNGKDLALCLKTIVEGFRIASEKVNECPNAISFGFPGPADYEKGVIYELVNLPAFKEPFPLKAFLEEEFGVPVFINNDADMFALGEFVYGLTRKINSEFKIRGSKRVTKNLIAATFGTGMGGGLIVGGRLFRGDNCAQGEINRMRNRFFYNSCAEDSVSSRGIIKAFSDEAKIPSGEIVDVKKIASYARDPFSPFHEQAKSAFYKFARSAADALADSVCLIDGLVVLGGGISFAHDVFLEKLVEEMNTPFDSIHGGKIPRTETGIFNLEKRDELEIYLEGKRITLTVPGSSKKVSVDTLRGTGVGITKLGTERAAALGAYVYALSTLDGS